MNSVSRLSVKKQKRNESRKRKIQAFLDIAKSNDDDRKRRFQRKSSNPSENKAVLPNDVHVKECQRSETSVDLKDDQDYQTLKSLVKERQKAKEKGPSFSLVGPGVAAHYPIEASDSQKALYVQDLQHLFLTALGQSLTYEPRWCRLVRVQKISHVVFLTFDGFCANHLRLMPGLQRFYENAVEFISPFSYNSSFLDEFLHVPLNLITTRTFLRSSCNTDPILKPLRSMFVINTLADTESKHKGDLVPRTHFLLSLPQMLAEGYPMPLDDHSKTDSYCFTKTVYKKVSEKSPIFAVDCEMCVTSESTHELTRISIVDEQLNVLYDTLVKPQNKIIHYLTKFSGITESMLTDVTIRLEDVQKVVQELLPEDAILCGQSLNFDLHAMKMMHPYVIDTSVIYNITGFRNKKSSLKLLTNIFLKKHIQCGTDGHDSIEDGAATMELVKLKLSKGLGFGDVLLGGKVPLSTDHTEIENNDIKEVPSEREEFSASNLLDNILAMGKSVCVIGTYKQISEYTDGISNEKCNLKATSNRSEIVQRTVETSIEHDVTFAHIPVKNEKHLDFVNSAVHDVYNACAHNALLIAIFADQFGNGVCMIKVKNSNVNLCNAT